MFELSLNSLIALLTLTSMEIVLGIDNIVFISILVSKLPKDLQEKARKLGISLALIIRVALLFSISFLMKLTEPFFSIFSHGFSGRDLILMVGGLFLIGKSTFEIHEKIETASGEENDKKNSKSKASFLSIILQILLLDIIFSLDSVITAVGMANEVSIMIIAMVVAMVVMLVFAKSIGDFVNNHPTIKILALSFLILIGVMLLMEGMGGHINKGYIYFAMAFSLAVEMINMKLRKSGSKK